MTMITLMRQPSLFIIGKPARCATHLENRKWHS
jgi:hypothetical protein